MTYCRTLLSIAESIRFGTLVRLQNNSSLGKLSSTLHTVSTYFVPSTLSLAGLI